MDIHEQLALRMAQERLGNVVREAEQKRAFHSARGRRSARVRLGSVLVRLGHWMIGDPSPVQS